MTRSTVTLKPSLEDSYVRVSLLNGCPELNFDFSRLSFHVPLNGSLCARKTPDTAKVKKTTAKIVRVRFMGYLLRKSQGWVFPVGREDGGRRVRLYRQRRQVELVRTLGQ